MRTLVFLGMMLCCTVATAQDAVDKVVVILDDSGSMNFGMQKVSGTRMQAARAALLTVLDDIPDDAYFGILLLNGDWKNKWAIPFGKINKDAVRAKVPKINASGDTKLGAALKTGADTLLENRAKFHYGSYRLLVISDGEANDPEFVDKYLPEIINRGITVDVVGVDMKNHTLSGKVRNYREATDPESLRQAIKTVFGETSTTSSAEDYELTSAIPEDAAMDVIKSLAGSGNHLIGEEPQATSSTTVPGAAAPAEDKNGSWSMLIGFFIGALIFALFLFFRG